MSTTFSVGDLVEAVKGERRIRDRVVCTTDNFLFIHGPYLGTPSISSPSSIAFYVQGGYTLTLIEKATPPLPTEPGVYEASDFPIAEGFVPYGLDADGRWFEFSEGGHRYLESMSEAVTLTRLEPVAVTAKKVLDRVREDFSGYPQMFVLDILHDVAEEYGVSA